jgi:hypothetical protein
MTSLLRDYDSRPGRQHDAATIGVVARPEDHAVVREFFELFKAPWEFYRSGAEYDVVLQADGVSLPSSARLVVVYGGGSTAFDEACRRLPGRTRKNVMVSCDGTSLPIYGRCVSISPDAGIPDVVFEDSQEPVAAVSRTGTGTLVRVGYDLFAEVRRLLTLGQPAEHAGIPTLERHIDLLRRWIVGAGIALVEVPPVPEGYPFTVCLTHDVDHPSIRLHRFDHTMFGFLQRAVVGSVVDACRGRTSLATLRRNFAAAATLPLVQAGWAPDIWDESFERYLELEKGLGSTFYVIPTRGTPGRTRDGFAPGFRASAYGASDIAHRTRALAAAGCDVGVHGIDAWLDSTSGTRERTAVARSSGVAASGVRMHWLYFDEQAPQRLEEAGFTYDSSFGYNDAVGFRAGTLQAFRPITARRLLELPLHIMDTALFYPGRMHLTATAAKVLVQSAVDQAQHHGGALTINWHDRSLAPERLWDGFYIELLEDLKRRSPWFPTASQAVFWFQRRRSARFYVARQEPSTVRVAVSADTAHEGPGLTLRVHTPQSPDAPWPPPAGSRKFTDVPFKDTLDTRVEI